MEKNNLKLEQISLSKKVSELCWKFLEETGEDFITVSAVTIDGTMTTDERGKAMYGKTLSVKVDSWRGENLDEEEE